MTEINLGWALAWRAAAGGVVLAAGGLALGVAAVAGLPGRDPSQRAFLVLFAFVLLVFGVVVLFAVRATALRLRVDTTGMTVEHRRHGGFTARWADLASVRMLREKRWTSRAPTWHYTLVLDPRRDIPSLDLWREGGGYRYELGRLGLAGRRMDRALARYFPAGYRGLAHAG
jgi:hypothetical protein